ncbi:MAG: serine O-acetyltransferase [Verrucomicrobiota bacterium]|nr:serine O-acetyltransferase [Verrucomicrobiota bacterium]
MDQHFTTVVEDLLRTYRENGGINYVEEAATLPSRQAIDASCAGLLSILFPGFHGEPLAHAGDLPAVTRSRVQELHARLKPEVCKSLVAVCANGEEIEARAEDVLRFFLSQMARLREMLWADIDAAYEGDPAARSYEEIILAYPTIEAIAIQRMAHLLYQRELPLIPRMMTAWAHDRTGIDIHPGAQIGSHFFIDHGTGVVIGETCVIGSHVKLYHGVTLGARSFQKDEQGHIQKGGKRHPNVEDYVTIYPNSTVLGGETVVGARSTIGGNVFLTHSVPPDSLVYYEAKQMATVPKRSRDPKTAHILAE